MAGLDPGVERVAGASLLWVVLGACVVEAAAEAPQVWAGPGPSQAEAVPATAASLVGGVPGVSQVCGVLGAS